MASSSVSYVIIGGGIAGVSCAERLAPELDEENVTVVSSSPLIKTAVNIRKVTARLEEFDIQEQVASSTLEQNHPNVKVLHDCATDLNAEKHELYLASGKVLHYKKLCICTGGYPKLISESNPYVLGIRDTESVKSFQRKLSNARRIVIVGNGGIATELVYEVQNCQVVWAVRHASIGATFFDAGAAEFFLPHLAKKEEEESKPAKRTKYTTEGGTVSASEGSLGSALGPDWSAELEMKGLAVVDHDVHVEYQCEIRRIFTPKEFGSSGLQITKLGNEESTWPVYVELTNGRCYGCDFVVSATGVLPNTAPFLKSNQFSVAEDGGLLVDDQMRTSIADVYAAGDVCTAGWETAPHWFQMRLWTQARQMGAYAGVCVSAHARGEEAVLDFCFELFAHVTRFFGYKVVLLGLYNCQGLGRDCELLVRVTPGKEYIKVVLAKGGRMQGAVLVGETDLEETFENLIINQMDLTPYGEDLLNPDIDIEDYFD